MTPMSNGAFGRDSGMSRRQALGLGALAIGGIPLAAACSNGGDSGGGSAVAAQGEKYADFELTSYGLSEDPPSAWLKKTISEYESEHDLTVTTHSYPWDSALNQMLLRSRSGELHGVAQISAEWLAPMAAAGKLVDISSIAAEADYTEAAARLGTLEGTQYAFPWTSGAIGLIANSELLDEAGIGDTPTTVDEFEEALRAIKDLGSDMVPYAASTKAATLKDFVAWAQTFGSPIIEDEKCTLGDEQSIAAMAWYQKLYKDGLIASEIDRNAARTLFAQKRTAFYDDAPVGVGIISSSSSDKDIASKMVPFSRPVPSPDDTPHEQAWGNILVIADGPGSAAAAQFCLWITTDQTKQIEHLKIVGTAPTTTAGLELPEVKDNEFIATFSKAITPNAAPSPLWKFTNYSQMQKAISDEVEKGLLGEASAKDAMEAARDAINELI